MKVERAAKIEHANQWSHYTNKTQKLVKLLNLYAEHSSGWINFTVLINGEI